mgnify:CR=1 FL=1
MTYVLRARLSVRFDTIAPAGFRILAALDRATTVHQVSLMITSGTDSHSAGRHPKGEAFDVSVADLSPRVIVDLYRWLTTKLGPLFTVLYESPFDPTDAGLRTIVTVNKHASGPHIHAQPVKGTVFPPEDQPDTVRV